MKKYIGLAVGGVVSLGCLYLVFRSVNLGELWAAVKAIKPLYLIGSLIAFYWSMYLRSVRWGLLFRPDYEFSGRRLFRPTMICFAFNSILPGRVGEIVRVFYVNKREGAPFGSTLATVVSERIFDGVTILSMLIISLAILPPIDPQLTVAFGKFVVTGAQIQQGLGKITIASGVLVAGVLVMMIPGVERMLERMIRGFPAMPQGIAARLVDFVNGIIRGFQAIRNPKNLFLIVFHSLAIWLLVALSNMILAYGMAGVSSISYLQSMATMCLIAVFILVPAAPGYWGLFEAGVIFSLLALGVQSDASLATAYALVMHLVQYVPIVVIGLFFAAQDQVRVKPAHPHKIEEPPAGPPTA